MIFTGAEARFVVETSAYNNKPCKAGLLVAFDGPSEPEIEFDHLKNGDTEVSYIPKIPGIYILSVKYSDIPCKGSPFKVHVSGRGAPVAKPNVVKRNIVKKVKISGEGLTEAKVDTPNEIILDVSRAEINCKPFFLYNLYCFLTALRSSKSSQIPLIDVAKAIIGENRIEYFRNRVGSIVTVARIISH